MGGPNQIAYIQTSLAVFTSNILIIWEPR